MMIESRVWRGDDTCEKLREELEMEFESCAADGW